MNQENEISFSPFYIGKAAMMKRHPKWKHYPIEEFSLKYSFDKIVSGAEFYSANSIIFIVTEKATKQKYLLKVVDPVRSAIFTERESVIEGSYKTCFKAFAKEIEAYIRLEGLETGVPKFYSFGILQNPSIDKFIDVLTIPENDDLIPITGFYILFEFIDGQPLSEAGFYGERKEQLYQKSIKVLNKFHELGVVHQNIVPENVLVQNGTDDPYFISFSQSETTSISEPIESSSDDEENNKLDFRRKQETDCDDIFIEILKHQIDIDEMSLRYRNYR
ncbi:uncharacterized protein RJT21DRAFT_118059 [Scheffersomyces amazonensis]|uniref:uncharacterized protein n=1 Tax=Scheffersomyces amazonensis TaxID=1078765 RepID=UPI00315DC04D